MQNSNDINYSEIASVKYAQEELLTLTDVMLGCSVAFHFHFKKRLKLVSGKKKFQKVQRHELYNELKVLLKSLISEDQSGLFDFFSVENFHSYTSEYDYKYLQSFFSSNRKIDKKNIEKNNIVKRIYENDKNQLSIDYSQTSLRYELKPFVFGCKKMIKEQQHCRVFLSFFPSQQTAILSLNLSLKNCTTDEIIYAQQLFEKNKDSHKISFSKGSKFPLNEKIDDTITCPAELSIDQIINLYVLSIIKCVVKDNDDRNGLLQKSDNKNKAKNGYKNEDKNFPKKTIHDLTRMYGEFTYLDQTEKSIYCEIRDIGNPFICNASEVVGKYPLQMYGILVRDEGWRYVPKQLALDRLKSNWGSRYFFNARIFKENTLLINLVHCTCVANGYSENSINPLKKEHHRVKASTDSLTSWDKHYYSSNFGVTALSHGVLLIIEKLLITRCLIAIAPKDLHIVKNSFSAKIKEIQHKRGNLLFLQKIFKFDISEINELKSIMHDDMGIPQRLQEINTSLNLYSEELKIAYEARTNKFITIFTWSGLIISVIGVSIAVVDCFFEECTKIGILNRVVKLLTSLTANSLCIIIPCVALILAFIIFVKNISKIKHSLLKLHKANRFNLPKNLNLKE